MTEIYFCVYIYKKEKNYIKILAKVKFCYNHKKYEDEQYL